MRRNFIHLLCICILVITTVATATEKGDNLRESEQLQAEIDSINTLLEKYSEEDVAPEQSDRKSRRKNRRDMRRARTAEERKDPMLYQVRRPNKITLHSRYSAVGPYNDHDANILHSFGFGYTRNINESFAIGAKDIGFNIFNTTSGDANVIMFAPKVEYTTTPAKWCQIGSEIGILSQIQFGSDIESNHAIIPFIGLMNHYYVHPRFSIGPELQFNFVAKGDYLIGSSDANSSTIPQNGAWIDAGLSLAFHF